MLTWLKDKMKGIPTGKGRSPKWPTVRKKFLKENPYCAICNGTKKLQAHHIKPFHIFPKLELNKNNLIALCEYNCCHLRFGHIFSFKSYNPNIKIDSVIWSKKIKHRP